MPFLVKHLIEGKPDPVTAAQDWGVARALAIMIEHDFSQLPVVDAELHPFGMVTYESILRGMRNFKVTINELCVRDVLVPAPAFNLEDDLFDMLAQLKLTNAVLIVDPGYELYGIVTSYDLTEYFQNRAENLMRVDDIELIIKEIILTAYLKPDGTTDEVRLAAAVSRVDHQDNSKKAPKTFNELSLGQYIFMIIARQTWPKFEPIFQISRDAVRTVLEGVRETRNDLAHFRNELTPEQVDQLRFCADWLGRRQSEYEERVKEDFRMKKISLPSRRHLLKKKSQKNVLPPTAVMRHWGTICRANPVISINCH